MEGRMHIFRSENNTIIHTSQDELLHFLISKNVKRKIAEEFIKQLKEKF